MTEKQPEALRLAAWLDGSLVDRWPSYVPQEAATELRHQHKRIEELEAQLDAARLEIVSLKARVRELGKMARDCNSRRVLELEAQLAAVGAGGVEPLRKRECLHQIIEPVQPMVRAIFAENGSCRMWTPDKSHAEATAKDIGLQVTPLYAAPQPAAQASECGNCFGGETDRGHACRKCGGTGVVQPAAQAQDAQRYRWLRDHRGWQVLHRIRPGKSIEYRMQDQDGEWWGHWWPTLEQAIDAARAAQKVK